MLWKKYAINFQIISFITTVWTHFYLKKNIITSRGMLKLSKCKELTWWNHHHRRIFFLNFLCTVDWVIDMEIILLYIKSNACSDPFAKWIEEITRRTKKSSNLAERIINLVAIVWKYHQNKLCKYIECSVCIFLIHSCMWYAIWCWDAGELSFTDHLLCRARFI